MRTKVIFMLPSSLADDELTEYEREMKHSEQL
jgi:hypothetical protein